MNQNVPTGNTGEVVRQYFDHLYSHYLQGIRQTDVIHWDTLGWFLLWFVVLSGLLYAYTRWQRSTHTPKEPYPVESYNGYIQEGNGPVGRFLTLFFAIIVIWLVITTIISLTRGQIY